MTFQFIYELFIPLHVVLHCTCKNNAAYHLISFFILDKMPRKYKRKIGAPVRAAWSEEALCKAFEEMDKGQVGVNEISRRYGIPSRTLRRRYAKKSCKKLTLGK